MQVNHNKPHLQYAFFFFSSWLKRIVSARWCIVGIFIWTDQCGASQNTKQHTNEAHTVWSNARAYVPFIRICKYGLWVSPFGNNRCWKVSLPYLRSKRHHSITHQISAPLIFTFYISIDVSWYSVCRWYGTRNASTPIIILAAPLATHSQTLSLSLSLSVASASAIDSVDAISTCIYRQLVVSHGMSFIHINIAAYMHTFQ